jgi:murein DD-endopeptidase MepM/ murein hydrolase activator NlpD
VAKSVAIRLATEGKAQVKNDFAEIAQAGEVSAKRLAATYDEQIAAAERAAERAARTAEKIAAIAPQTPMQMQVNSAAGSNLNYQSASGGMAGDYEGSARRSAAAMKELVAEEGRLEQRTRALLSAIDPVWAAQDRFNRELAEAKSLLDAGRISTDQYATAERRAKEALDDTTKSAGRAAEMSNQARFGYRQIQYQLSDVGSQAIMGTSPFVIFAQQVPDFLYALQMISDGAGQSTAALSLSTTATNAHAGAARTDARDTAAQAVSADAAAAALAAHLAAVGPDGVATNAHAGAARADAAAMTADAVATEAGATAAGAHVVAVGADTTATGAHATAVGTDTVATGANTVATVENEVATTGAAAAKARLVAFMTGPYGAAVLGAITLVGIFATKMDWSSDRVAKATKELEKQAKETDATREAQERWRYTIEGLIEASRKLEEQTKHLNESSREAASRAIVEAGETLNLTIAKREQAKATLEQTKAELARLDLLAKDPNNGLGPLMAGAWAEDKMKELKDQIAELDGAIHTDKAAITELEIAKGKREAAALTDAATRANENYADSVDRIEHAFRRSGKSAADYMGYVTALALAEQQHKVDLDAARASERDPTRTRFAAPLSSMNVLHPFGERRGSDVHGGVDLQAPVGSMVRADAAGIARRKNAPNGYGYYVELDHGRGVKSRFAHLQSYLVADGSRVEQGDPIGLSGGAKGMTGAGNSSGPHLHYEVRKGGKPVNPMGGEFGIDPLAASSGSGESRAETLRRQAEAMEASTSGALALAEAYLKSGAAAVLAEAQREGATDAIRSGAEAEAQVRRQLNLDVAEGAAQGAKAVAGMREETSARAAINDGVSSGAIALADMNRVLGEEAALRPLLKLQAVAQGDALTTLTKVIEAYRKALADAHSEEARGQALAAIDASAKRIEDIRAMIPLVGDPNGREIEEARRAAIREADDKGLKPTDIERTDLIDSRVDQVRAEQDLRRAEYVAGAKREQEDNVSLLRLELELLGESDQLRERSLRRLAYELELNRELGPEYAEQINELLRRAEVEESLRAEVEKTRDSLEEARQIGENFVDTLFDPRNWKDWGDLGKRILNDLAEDMIRLAILNPIKNELFGQNNPTAGSVFEAFGSFFGSSEGADAGQSILDSLGSATGSNAMGTEYFSGGLTRINENGDELVELPRGSKIRPAAETRRILAANDGGRRVVQHFDLRGAVVTEDLYRQMKQTAAKAVEDAAPGIAEMGMMMTVDAYERRMWSV